MNDDQIRQLALIYSIQAQIEAMKVDNKLSEYNGLPPHWTSDHFVGAANDLDRIATTY